VDFRAGEEFQNQSGIIPQPPPLTGSAKWWANHNILKTRRHQDYFVPLWLGDFVKQKTYFISHSPIHSGWHVFATAVKSYWLGTGEK
jgi:hypothetical protein